MRTLFLAAAALLLAGCATVPAEQLRADVAQLALDMDRWPTPQMVADSMASSYLRLTLEAGTYEAEYVDAYYNRGILYRKAQHFEDAIKDFTTAIKIDPNSENAYFQRAVARQTLKEYRSAIADFDRVIDLNDKNGSAYCFRGNCKQQLGYLEDACYDWQTALNKGYNQAQAAIKEYCRTAQ